MPRPLHPRLLAAAAAEPASDAELLRRFVRGGDAAAFELVVRRHAAAVWAACRRILPEADAEDAFQAAFLVLARKAAAVRGASAGGWLHRVAVTAALKHKARTRPPASRGHQPPDSVEPADPLERDELAAAVHEELARLPDRYRLPVVLCDLEGETQPAAAARLGWPVGSVAGRLSRARALLRDRLTRRGFAPAGSILVLPLLGVPARSVTAAVAAATGAAAPSTSVSLLATGVLTAMRIAKLKLTAGLVAGACLVGAAGFGAYRATAQPLPAPQDPTAGAAKSGPGPGPAAAQPPLEADWLTKSLPPPSAFPDILPAKGRGDATEYPALYGPGNLRIDPTDTTHRRLLKAQLQQYREYLMRTQIRLEFGSGTATEFATVADTCERVRVVASDVWRAEPQVLETWLVDLVRYAKTMERIALARVEAGTEPPQAGHLVAAQRLGLEAALWRHRNPGGRP